MQAWSELPESAKYVGDIGEIGVLIDHEDETIYMLQDSRRQVRVWTYDISLEFAIQAGELIENFGLTG